MNDEQLKASLRKSAEIIRAIEKDRDDWKKQALQLTERLKHANAALVAQRQKTQQAEARIVTIREEFREFSERIIA